jgi:uncharacterized membrane protein
MVLVLLAAVLLVRPPRKINWWYGYRTPRSMRSQAAWEDANRLAAQLLVLVGVLSFNTGLTCWFFSRRPEVGVAIVAIVTSVLGVGIVLLVELYLARNFDREGRPVEGGRQRRREA